MSLSGWWPRIRADADRAMESQRREFEWRLAHPGRFTLFMERHRWLSRLSTFAVFAIVYLWHGFVITALVTVAVLGMQLWQRHQLN